LARSNPSEGFSRALDLRHRADHHDGISLNSERFVPEPSPAEYDALPYEGHPDPMIHPDRMAAVAWLHGVSAAPLETARVLEIGCATGAHLIPMAYRC
jgi:hypothetical protein